MGDALDTPRTSNLSPHPGYRDEISNASNAPPSPSAIAFLQAAVALDGLSQELGSLTYGDEDDEAEDVQCCCGRSSSARECSMSRAKEKVDQRLRLSGGMSLHQWRHQEAVYSSSALQRSGMRY